MKNGPVRFRTTSWSARILFNFPLSKTFRPMPFILLLSKELANASTAFAFKSAMVIELIPSRELIALEVNLPIPPLPPKTKTFISYF